jgi:ketosteroid isomerase-like protein
MEQGRTEQTRELVERYLDVVIGDPARSHEQTLTMLMDLLHDEIHHAIVGDLILVGGDYHGKEETNEILARAGTWFTGRGSIVVRSVVVDGERAAIEWVRTATYWNGRPYRKEYGVFLEARDGKLISVREYLP